MENIKLLPVSEDRRERLQQFSAQYQRHAGIFFKVLEVETEKMEIVVRLVQKRNSQDKYLTQKELVDRGKDLFDGEIPSEYKIHFRAIEYKPMEIDVVDSEWIKSQMKIYDLQNKDLVQALGVDRFVISKIVNGSKEVNSFQRSAFYYYFKCLSFQGNKGKR